MFAAALGAGRQRKQIRFAQICVLADNDVGDARLAACQGAGLVQDDRGQLMGALQRLAVLEQDTGLGPFAHADHDRGRRRQSHRARAGDDQHGDHAHQRGREVASRRQPDEEHDDGDGDHHRHEHRRNLVGDLLDRRLAALRLLDQADDLSQRRLPPHARCPELEQPLFVDRGPDHFHPRQLIDRQALAGNHALINSAVTLQHHAVDGDLLAGAHDHLVPDSHLRHRDIDLYPVADDPRRLGAQAHQLLDGGARPALGPHLQ